MPAVRQTLPVAHLVPPTWRFLSSRPAAEPTPILPRQSRSRAAFPAHWAAHGQPCRPGPRPRHRTAARIPPCQAFRSSHDRQLAGRMDAAHVPGRPHPGLSSHCLPSRRPGQPHHEGPPHEACRTTAQHPLSSHPTGRRPEAAHVAMPHSAARHFAVLPPVAAHFVAHQAPLLHQSGANRSGIRRPPGAGRLVPYWLDLHCPGPDRAGAQPCSRRYLGRPRAGHVRRPVPNPVPGPAYLGGPPDDALGNRRPGDRQTTRTTCLAGQVRPSPSPDAPLPRSSSKLASRPPCR
jgi:hypothetical protein